MVVLERVVVPAAKPMNHPHLGINQKKASGCVKIAIENGSVIVDLPINSMVMFHSYICKRLLEGI